RQHRVAALFAVLGRARPLPPPRRPARARGRASRYRRVMGQLRLRHRYRDGRSQRASEGRLQDVLPQPRQGLHALRRLLPAARKRPADPLLPPRSPAAHAVADFPDGKVRAVARTNAPGRVGERWFDNQLAEQAWQRHILQVGYTDRLLGTFLRRLHQTGLWNRALVVVTADHGISFRGGDLRRRPTKPNLAGLGFTPLFIRLPGQQHGRVVDGRHVVTVDILPTIADVLGIKIPWHIDGASALARRPGSRRVEVAGVSAPYEHELAQRRASLARQLDVLGSGSWGRELAATGRYRGLVGKPLGALQIVGSAPGSATIDAIGSRLVRAFPKRWEAIPSPLTGPVSGLRGGARSPSRSTAGSQRCQPSAAGRASRRSSPSPRFAPGATRCVRSSSRARHRLRSCGSSASGSRASYASFGSFARSAGTKSRQCGHLNPRALGASEPTSSSASNSFPQCGQTTGWNDWAAVSAMRPS